jgi:hypothetical protein
MRDTNTPVNARFDKVKNEIGAMKLLRQSRFHKVKHNEKMSIKLIYTFVADKTSRDSLNSEEIT